MALRWVSRYEDGKLLELVLEHVCDSSIERCASTRRSLKETKGNIFSHQGLCLGGEFCGFTSHSLTKIRIWDT